jgi:two-component system sensor histidine kinase/response regulator
MSDTPGRSQASSHRSPQGEGTPVSAANPADHGGDTPRSLLIVDDDPAMVQVLAATVRELGKLRFATSGQAAMRLIGEALPDVVLLDADMPGMDGFEVLRQIKGAQTTRDVPVIMVTGLATEAHEKTGLELGAADFIAKPFRPSIVLARVRTQLHLKRVSDQLKALSAIDRQNLDHALVELQSRNVLLTQTSAQLERAHHGLLQFVNAASHDLREPLNTITQFSGLVLDDAAPRLDAGNRQHLQRIVRAGDRMKSLLDDVVTYARLLSEAPAEGERVELDAVARDVRHALAEAIHDSGLVLTWQDLPTVRGARASSVEAFRHLVLNAIRYADPQRPPTLAITARTDGGLVRIGFQDNGIGIDASHWERVFEPFRRLHRRDVIAGNGMGLTIARQLAEAHGGSLRIVASGPQGSTFCLTMPAAPTRCSSN